MISRELEDADQVGEVSWRSVGEDDDLQTAGQQGAMEDVLLQNTLQHTHTHTPPLSVTAADPNPNPLSENTH